MSSHPGSRRRRRDPVSVPELPDVILRAESQGDLGDPGLVVAEAEARASVSARPNANCSKRMRANQLHSEADQLYYKGDYESALVLYHRAAKLCPREHSHSVAAWRIQTAITSSANPSSELSIQLKEARSPGQMSAVLMPEVAARRAGDVVAESPDPIRDIPSILRFFESRKDFWHLSSPSTSPRQSRSKMMLKQLNRCAKSTFKDLETAYEAGDTNAVHELGDVLMNLASVSEEPVRNQLDLYGYLVGRQIALKRHDRAVNLSVKMIFLARTCGNVNWMTEALVTIGKVHLAFGHLDALIRVWDRFIHDLNEEPIPQAWLYHDIGRCHLELADYHKALKMAGLCLERAEYAESNKWMLRGHLLTGQSLLKLKMFGKAVDALKKVAMLALEEDKIKDRQKSIILYVQDLIEQVTYVLRRLNQENNYKAESQTSNDHVTAADSPMNSLDQDNKIGQNDSPRLMHGNLARDEENAPKQWRQQFRGRTLTDFPADISDEEMIAQLFNKREAPARAQSLLLTPMTVRDKGVKVPRVTAITGPEPLSSEASEINGEDVGDVDLNLESSRTRIIRQCNSERNNSDDEKTLKPDELTVLSDVSGQDDTGEEDFTSARLDDGDLFDIVKAEAIQSGVNSPNTSRTAHSDVSEEVTEKSVSYFSPEEELTSPSLSFSLNSEVFMSPNSETHSKYNSGMLSYLKSLKSHDFEMFRKEERRFFERRSTE